MIMSIVYMCIHIRYVCTSDFFFRGKEERKEGHDDDDDKNSDRRFCLFEKEKREAKLFTSSTVDVILSQSARLVHYNTQLISIYVSRQIM